MLFFDFVAEKNLSSLFLMYVFILVEGGGGYCAKCALCTPTSCD